MPEPEESIEIGGWKLTRAELRALLERGGDNPFLLAEAIASTLLDQDARARTIALPPTDQPMTFTDYPPKQVEEILKAGDAHMAATEASPHVAKLLNCVLEIRKWHVQATPQPLCAYCWKPWPCPTRRITDEVVEGDQP